MPQNLISMFAIFHYARTAMSLLLVGTITVCPIKSWSQDPVASAKEVFEQAQQLYLMGNYQGAIDSYQEFIRSTPVDTLHAFAYEGMGDCLYELGKKARDYTPNYQKALEVRQKMYPPVHDLIAKTHNDLAYCWSVLENMDSMAHHVKEGAYIDSVLYIQHPDPAKAKNLGVSYSNLGYYWGMRGDWDLQLAYYQKGLTYKVESKTKDSLSVFYNNVATGFWYRNENQLAKQYIDLAIKMVLSEYPDSLSIEIIKPFNNLSAILDQEQNHEKQARILRIALNIMNKLPERDSAQTMQLFLNLGYSFMKQEVLDSAAYYLDKGLLIASQLDKPESKIVGYINKGGVAFMQQNYPQAENWFTKAKRLQQKQYGSFHPNLANNLISLGKCKEFQGKYDIAIDLYQQAIQSNQNPLTSKRREGISAKYQVFSPYQLLNAWSRVGETLMKQYQQTNEPAYLERAMDIYRELNTYNLELRSTYSHPHDRNRLQATLKQTYAKGIEAAWELYSHSKSPDLLEEIFAFMQTQKALSLFEHLQGSRAWTFANIPDSVRIREYTLQRDLSYYQKLISLKNPDANTGSVNEWYARGLSLSREYEALIRDMEDRYPDYYALKYKNPVLRIAEARALLEDAQSGLLEYYIADSIGYVISILPDTVGFRTFEINGMYHDLVSLKQAMRSNSGATEYTSLAVSLYQQLIAPEFRQLHTDKWVIIPDAFLHYMPFEALITREPGSTSVHFGTLPYVLNDYTLSYASSCALLAAEKTDATQINPGEMIAIAPVFDREMMAKYAELYPGPYHRESLIPQLNSKEFIARILSWIRGKYLFRYQAQESTFKKEAGKHQLIHLSTHAFVNDSLPMQSHFVLAKPLDTTSSEDGYVYVHEIFSLGLNAKLAVLTACKTGLGKFQPGEGVMSLARAFQYAGCPSIMMSMWEIDEYASNEVLELFYEGLKNGLSKRDALKQAKLTFLKRHEYDSEKTSPDQWAGIVLLGNYDSIDLAVPSAGLTGYVWGVVVLLVLGMIAWIWIRKSAANQGIM